MRRSARCCAGLARRWERALRLLPARISKGNRVVLLPCTGARWRGLLRLAGFRFCVALGYLGNVAFREPVPAYKHSAAVFLHLTGRIPTDLPHPRNARRPAWEREILQDCARRIDAVAPPGSR